MIVSSGSVLKSSYYFVKLIREFPVHIGNTHFSLSVNIKLTRVTFIWNEWYVLIIIKVWLTWDIYICYSCVCLCGRGGKLAASIPPEAETMLKNAKIALSFLTSLTAIMTHSHYNLFPPIPFLLPPFILKSRPATNCSHNHSLLLWRITLNRCFSDIHQGVISRNCN